MTDFLTRLSLATRLPLALAIAAGVAFAACDSDTDGTDAAGDPDVATAGDAQADVDGTADDVATEGDATDLDIPYVVPNPTGKKHGDPCTEASECQFLTCIDAPSLTGGAFRICTKDCSEGPNAPCSLEGPDFTCARFSPGSGDGLTAFCTRTCASLADCPEGYASCKVVNALKVCTAP